MTAGPLTITAFLEARIAEDEAVSEAARYGFSAADVGEDEGAFLGGPGNPARVLAQCKVHRAILAKLSVLIDYDRDKFIVSRQVENVAHTTLRALASIWSDHPDFEASWAL